MNDKKDTTKLSLKLSLKKETLRVLNDSDLRLLDEVVGGTAWPGMTDCENTECQPY